MKEKATDLATVDKEVQEMAKDFFDLGVAEGFETAIKLLKNAKMDNYHNKIAERFAEYLEANRPE